MSRIAKVSKSPVDRPLGIVPGLGANTPIHRPPDPSQFRRRANEDLPVFPQPLTSEARCMRLAAFRLGSHCYQVERARRLLELVRPPIAEGEARAELFSRITHYLDEYTPFKRMLADFLSTRARERLLLIVQLMRKQVDELYAGFCGLADERGPLVDPFAEFLDLVEKSIDRRFPLSRWVRLGLAFGKWEYGQELFSLACAMRDAVPGRLGPAFGPVLQAAALLSRHEAAEHPALALLCRRRTAVCGDDERDLRNALIASLNQAEGDQSGCRIRTTWIRIPYRDTTDLVAHFAEFPLVVEGLREQIEAHLATVPRSTDPGPPTTPLWDRDTGRLWWGDRIILTVKAGGAFISRKILDAFETEGWRDSIPAPFTQHEKTDSDVSTNVRDLNRMLDKPTPIKFHMSQPHIRWALQT